MPSPVSNQTIPSSHLAANSSRVNLVKNPDAENGLCRSFIKFCGRSEAVFRVTQLMERIPKFGNEVLKSWGKEPLAPLEALSKRSLLAWTGATTGPRVVEVIVIASEANEEARAALADGMLTEAQVDQKIAKAASATAEAVSMSCHLASMMASFFAQGGPLSKMFTTTAETVGLAHDSIECDLHRKNLQLAYSVDLAGATDEMKEAVQQTKDNNWIAIAKDVCSVVSGVFTLLLAVTGVTFLSSLTSATLSLGATTFAVIRKMHEMGMTYKPINFTDVRLLA